MLLNLPSMNPEVNETNAILRNATIPVPLKYLSHFWKLLEMPLINCKAALKLKWMKHCVLTELGNENDGVNYNIITNEKNVYDQSIDSDLRNMRKQKN